MDHFGLLTMWDFGKTAKSDKRYFSIRTDNNSEVAKFNPTGARIALYNHPDANNPNIEQKQQVVDARIISVSLPSSKTCTVKTIKTIKRPFSTVFNIDYSSTGKYLTIYSPSQGDLLLYETANDSYDLLYRINQGVACTALFVDDTVNMSYQRYSRDNVSIVDFSKSHEPPTLHHFEHGVKEIAAIARSIDAGFIAILSAVDDKISIYERNK
jgi:hypothetical protein